MTDPIGKLIESDREQYTTLDDIGYTLEHLAKSFGRVGNCEVAEELSLMAGDIFKASETLRGNSSERTTIRYNEARASSTNLLNAALSVAIRAA